MESDDKFVPMGTKVTPSAAVVWNEICQAKQTDTYHMLQMFIYAMIRAASERHELSPEIKRLMLYLETDYSWQHAFNIANPDRLKVSQLVLILEQKNHRGHGAVMVENPFFMTAKTSENVGIIVDRIIKVTVPGLHRRLMRLGKLLDMDDIIEVLLYLVDSETAAELQRQDEEEMRGPNNYTDYGREYAYGKRTKQTKRHTPDCEHDRQMKLNFKKNINETDTDRIPGQEQGETSREGIDIDGADW